ncbi:BamA/TamA family outer membrane protein [Adhaeribacter aquaticus]|uniref:BamA/TamA family outer membrane protein n=1 Tax=Adhaeribacter aquaticus TaxID=299567 RepID=UPI000425A693|nr:BamA/TamA family outer membrane protein [Adhaeribacter aquaticus]
MKTGFLTIIVYLSFSTVPAFGQVPGFVKQYVQKLLYDTTAISKPRFLAYPTVAYGPETSWEFGLSSLYVYYARQDTTNRLSEINGFTFFTLENQYGMYFDHALYSHQNKWIFPGRFRFQSFPMLYYGIGPDSPAEYIARIDARQLQMKERALRRIFPNLYLGPEIDFQRLSSVKFISSSDEPITLPVGSKGYTNLGLGAGLIYDKRHNVLNVREGIFSELAILRYHNGWGSDFSFTSVISDNRFYKRINQRDVLAMQVLGQFNSGDIPFNQLALLGGESINRGYYLGRFRDNNQLAAQVEYRLLPLPFAKRWGAAVFGSAGTVFNQFANLSAKDLVYSGGGGVRFLLFPKKDIFTRFDIAFTKEKPGFYIFIGEAL